MIRDNIFTIPTQQIYGLLLKVEVVFENSMTMTSLEYKTSVLKAGWLNPRYVQSLQQVNVGAY